MDNAVLELTHDLESNNDLMNEYIRFRFKLFSLMEYYLIDLDELITNKDKYMSNKDLSLLNKFFIVDNE